MQHKNLKTSLFILLTFLFIGCSQSGCPSKPISESISSLAELNNFSGTILVAFKDSILVDFCMGYTDGNKNVAINSETPMAIASITKLFIKHSIFLLEKQGKISLNDKLSKFRTDIQYSDSITISDLIYHSSGLPDIHNEIALFNDPWTLNKPVSTEDLFAKIKSLGYIHFKPGTNSRYSNSNYLILAYIIESISGMSLDIFLDKNIFTPYGMKSTGLYKEHSSIPGHAQGFYRHNNEIVWLPDFNFKNFWGSGNGYSTSNDLFKYFLNVKKHLNPKYGKQLIQHSGYYLGFRSTVRSIPELGISIIVLTNNGDFNPEIISNLSLSLLANKITPYRDPNNTVLKINGRYSATKYNQRIDIEIVRDNECLIINSNKTIRVDKNIYILPQNGFATLSIIEKEDGCEVIEINDNGIIFELKPEQVL